MPLGEDMLLPIIVGCFNIFHCNKLLSKSPSNSGIHHTCRLIEWGRCKFFQGIIKEYIRWNLKKKRSNVCSTRQMLKQSASPA